MIHYTLLPEKEIKNLKKEYRTRLLIFLIFFSSCAVLVGIGSLMPAYIFSYSQEKTALQYIQSSRQDREESGLSEIINQLSIDNEKIKFLKENTKDNNFTDLIMNITKHKPNNVYVNSLQLISNASSSVSVIIQGRSLTREGLLLFKKNLEEDPLISDIELPVSDLAKSKNISFSIKLNIVKIK